MGIHLFYMAVWLICFTFPFLMPRFLNGFLSGGANSLNSLALFSILQMPRSLWVSSLFCYFKSDFSKGKKHRRPLLRLKQVQILVTRYRCSKPFLLMQV